MAHLVSLKLQEDGSIFINGGLTRTDDGALFPIRAYMAPGDQRFGVTYDELHQMMTTYGGGMLDEHGIHPPKPEDLV